MSDRISSLRLDLTTTREQLEKFLGEDSSKVRAQRNDDGSVTLFTTDRATGWWGRLTGFSKERETARAALKEWSRQQLGPDLSPEAKQVLDSRIGAGKVNVLAVRQLVAELGKLKQQPPETSYRAILPRDGVIRESLDGKTPSVLTLGGSNYVIGGSLGRGAESEVYEGVSETGEKIAIKRPHKTTAHEETEREFRVHERAMGAGRDLSHILGLKTAVMGNDGRIQAIVVEHMPGGDALALLGKLDTAERNRLISSEDARLVRLTLAKDMATGLAQLHETRGLLHCDVKPENFLIGADGVVKVSDFGASQPQEEMHGRALENPKGTLRYIAPEVNRAPTLIATLDEEIAKLESRARQRGFTKEALSDLAQSRKLREEIDTTSIDSKADVFSLGLSLVHVFEGKTLADVGGVDKNLKPLATGSNDERNAVLSKLGVTSDSPEHGLIRAMLAGKPEDRPTTRQVLESPLFNEKGVGSEETRKLLLAIAQDTLGTGQQ